MAKQEAAAIRYKNPGAQWDGKIAKKWGSTGTTILKDGQNNHIAEFPTYVQGAAAQFDLWKTNYSGMTLNAATTKWSGGNSSPAYISFLTKKVPGLTKDTVITKDYLAGPKGLALMKAQAQWEAGKVYPMTDAEWVEAQKKVFGSTTPPAAGTIGTPVIVGGGAIAGASMFDTVRVFVEHHWVGMLIGAIALGVVIDLGIALYKNGKKNVANS